MATPMSLALQNLKENQHYQIVVQELQKVKSSIEQTIFNEAVSHERKELLIGRRNTIQNFIDLPDDLIALEVINE